MLSRPEWIHDWRFSQPTSVYRWGAQVTVRGFMPYLNLRTWAVKALSLPPLPGTMQS